MNANSQTSENPSTMPPEQTTKVIIDPFDPKSFQTAIINKTDLQKSVLFNADVSPGDKAVKLITFDMGHVFVDFDWNEVCQGFMSKHPALSRDDVRDAMSYLGSLGYERGEIGTLDFLNELNQKLGIALTLDEFRVVWNLSFVENPEMAALLQTLSKQLPLYLLSNTNEAHYNYLQSTFNVARHFQELILSYEVGLSKPDLQIYHQVLQRSQLAPENILFVDDLSANVQAAQAIGMQAHLFTDIDKLKQELKSYGFAV